MFASFDLLKHLWVDLFIYVFGFEEGNNVPIIWDDEYLSPIHCQKPFFNITIWVAYIWHRGKEWHSKGYCISVYLSKSTSQNQHLESETDSAKSPLFSGKITIYEAMNMHSFGLIKYGQEFQSCGSCQSGQSYWLRPVN